MWGSSIFSFCAKTKLYTIYMGLLWRHLFKMASQAATCMPSSNLLCNKGQRSGQVYHILLQREAYYSSHVSRIYRASKFVELSALETDGTIERCGCDFHAAQQ